MKQALTVIADQRASTRLRTFLESGADRKRQTYFSSEICAECIHLAGEPTQVKPDDWPRGLNQLGNTCYLNSLRESSELRAMYL